MNISETFIKRPVMTTLVMVAITFFGILAYQSMPVSDLPSVDFPTIEVNVTYPGADPKTITNNVIVPLEQQFTTLQGIQTISSTSYSGSAVIVLSFHLDRSIDLAAPDVQAAINAATPHLPKDLPYAPTYTKVNPTATPIMIFTVTSPTVPLYHLYDYGYSVLAQQLNIIEGVAQVQTYGSPYAVRLRVDPQKLAARGIDINSLSDTIRTANVYLPTGTLFGQNDEFTISANGQMYEAEEYNNIIIKNDNGSFVRFSDIGYALDSLQNDKYTFRFLTSEVNQDMVALGIQKQAGANTLDVIKRIKAALPVLEKQLPASVSLYNMYDQSDYIIEAVDDVKWTLLIALCLVVAVIFIYLGRVVNTFIPAITIPITVIGTFIVMKLMGFTIDVLSLLAITLAIGFLVDDAVVVLENIVRHVEQGEKTYDAALNGSKEISFTILSMTLSLASVFIPLVFMAGIVGRILNEFAVTIVTAILISGFVSLSLTPLLCSRMIPQRREKESRMERFSLRFNEKLVSYYRPTLEWALKHKKSVLTAAVLSVIGTFYLIAILPKDFLPGDDVGFIQGFTKTTDGTSPFLTGKFQRQTGELFMNDPNVEAVVSIGANPQDNQGITFIKLKPFKERRPILEVTKELYMKLAPIPGLQMFLRPLPLINLDVGTSTAKGDYQYVIQGINADDVYKYGDIMEKKIRGLKGFTSVTSDLDMNQPQLQVEIQRDRASILNISAWQIENALGLAYAGTYLSPINEPQNQYYAIMETIPKFYRAPDNLKQIWLRSSKGDLVPLSAVIKTTEGVGPLTENHLNGLPSVTITFNLAAGVSLSDALKNLDSVAKETLPTTLVGIAAGTANVFTSSFATLNFLLLITIFVIYLILGILYENFLPPIAVMSTLAPAALGGLLSLVIFNYTLSLYAFVGIIMLLGIVMKNGIIMVDFANESVAKEKKAPHDAILHACLVRFRPILMTTLSAMMGAVPIAIGFGGMTAQSRKSLGVVIVGGLIFSQILTLYLTPVIYVYLELLKEKLKKKEAKG
ncbi:MAG: efflux RND transporter permease subunit [Chlamydiales bacterium]|nr:efflux RND transporter permease subunit [Chlamydiales bacterium]